MTHDIEKLLEDWTIYDLKIGYEIDISIKIKSSLVFLNFPKLFYDNRN